MLINPFWEGLICILFGVGILVAAKFLAMAELSPIGQTVIGIGIGYIGGHAVAQTRQ